MREEDISSLVYYRNKEEKKESKYRVVIPLDWAVKQTKMVHDKEMDRYFLSDATQISEVNP